LSPIAVQKCQLTYCSGSAKGANGAACRVAIPTTFDQASFGNLGPPGGIWQFGLAANSLVSGNFTGNFEKFPQLNPEKALENAGKRQGFGSYSRVVKQGIKSGKQGIRQDNSDSFAVSLSF
jgi:hypothetical protein